MPPPHVSHTRSKSSPAISTTSSGIIKWAHNIANSWFKPNHHDDDQDNDEWFDPEDLTESKREWIDKQAAAIKDLGWPTHIFDACYVVGLPPTADTKSLAAELAASEATSSSCDAKYTPQSTTQSPSVLFKFPASASPPLSEEELVSLCFPQSVSTERLQRTPSFSSLNEMLYDKQQIKDGDCSVFMLKVGESLPLYGVCCYVKDLVHRPPYIARERYAACKTAMKECLIATRRCYCLLSRYPFFELHYQVIHVLLNLERLNRTMQYDLERSLPPTPPQSPQLTLDICSTCSDAILDMLPSARLAAIPTSPATPARPSAPCCKVCKRALNPTRPLSSSSRPHHGLSPSSFPITMSAPAGQSPSPPTTPKVRPIISPSQVFNPNPPAALTLPAASTAPTSYTRFLAPTTSSLSTATSDSSLRSILSLDASTPPPTPTYADSEAEPSTPTADPFTPAASCTRQPSLLQKMRMVWTSDQGVAAGGKAEAGENRVDSGWGPAEQLSGTGGAAFAAAAARRSMDLVPSQPVVMQATTAEGWDDAAALSSKSLPPSIHQRVCHSAPVSPLASAENSPETTSTHPFTDFRSNTPIPSPFFNAPASDALPAAAQQSGSDTSSSTPLSGRSCSSSYTPSTPAEGPPCMPCVPCRESDPQHLESCPAAATSTSSGGYTAGMLPNNTTTTTTTTTTQPAGHASPGTRIHRLATCTTPLPPTPHDPSSSAPQHGDLEGPLRVSGEGEEDGEFAQCCRQDSPERGVLVTAASSSSTASEDAEENFQDMLQRCTSTETSTTRRSVSRIMYTTPRVVLERYYGSRIPLPGEPYVMSFGTMCLVEYQRPMAGGRYPLHGSIKELLVYADADLAHNLRLWAVASLCRSLPLEPLLTLLTAALLEKRIVMAGGNISAVTSGVLALLPLLRPFTWQSLLLPVTPASMLGFLDAPVPFLLGLHLAHPHTSARLDPGIVLADLDRAEVRHSEALPALPSLKKLHAALAPHHAALRQPHPAPDPSDPPPRRPVFALEEAEQDAAMQLVDSCKDFLQALCGDLRPHTIINVGMQKKTGTLLKDSLAASFRAPDRPFIRQFMSTQMFQAYSDTVIGGFCEDA